MLKRLTHISLINIYIQYHLKENYICGTLLTTFYSQIGIIFSILPFAF